MGAETVNRHPKGIPTGGQFAPGLHAEPELDRPLDSTQSWSAALVSGRPDADGDVWDHDGDEYSDRWTASRDGLEMIVTTDLRDDQDRWTVRTAGRQITTGQASTLEEAVADAKAARTRLAGYGHNRMHVGGPAFRGRITATEEVAPGIDSVHTEHHGFYVLTDGRNAEVDLAWRQASGWYEGDCNWVVPVITHHRDLGWQLVRRAHEEARRYFPEQYDAVVGKDPARYGVTDWAPAR